MPYVKPDPEIILITQTKGKNMSKALLVLSGGQDSTICAFWAIQQGYSEVHAITFDYQQKHSIEIESAIKIGELAGVRSHEIIKLGPILEGSSPLTNLDAELEQYEEGELPGGLEKTFVPGRNLLFLTLAANRAYVMNCGNIITGVCGADSGGYPDCTQPFIDYFEEVLSTGMFTGLDGAPGTCKIHTPLMFLTKAQSVDFALKLSGCYAALAWSHTAYDGQYPPTGKDHATVLRGKGFKEAGVPDPLILRAYKEKLIDKLPSWYPSKKKLTKFMELANLA